MDIKSLLAVTPKLSEGEFVTPQPSLEDMVRVHYERIAGVGGAILADRYLSRLREIATDPTINAAQPEEIGQIRQAETEPEAEATTTRAQAEPDPKPATADAEPAPDPLDSLRESLKEIGLDFRIGGVDVFGGLDRASKGGSAIPLLTGLTGVLLGAIATSEAKKRKS